MLYTNGIDAEANGVPDRGLKYLYQDSATLQICLVTCFNRLYNRVNVKQAVSCYY
jgi:hypothetical protein